MTAKVSEYSLAEKKIDRPRTGRPGPMGSLRAPASPWRANGALDTGTGSRIRRGVRVVRRDL